MDLERNGNLTESERNWNENGMELEPKWNGKERKMNGNGTKIERIMKGKKRK